MERNPILERYIPLVEYIGQTFGENCEVILHDLTTMEHSIVAIANQQVTGRDIGGHITDFGLEVVHDPKYVDKDFAVNYRGTTPDGQRTLKSSTFFIRDDGGEIVGLLCINFDITGFLAARKLLESFTRLTDKPGEAHQQAAPSLSSVETFSSSVEDTLHSVVDRTVEGCGVAPYRMTTEEKKRLVETLQSKGIFALKGAVGMVAKRLDVSEQTIYRYLREVHG